MKIENKSGGSSCVGDSGQLFNFLDARGNVETGGGGDPVRCFSGVVVRCGSQQLEVSRIFPLERHLQGR